MSCRSSKHSPSPSCSFDDDSMEGGIDAAEIHSPPPSRCRSSSATVVQVISRQSTASPPVAIDVEKLEQQMADKKKRTVTFSDKPPEKHSAVVYETENEVPVKLSFRERFFLLLRRLILLFILVFLIAFIVFLAVQSYENGKKQASQKDQ